MLRAVSASSPAEWNVALVEDEAILYIEISFHVRAHGMRAACTAGERGQQTIAGSWAQSLQPAPILGIDGHFRKIKTTLDRSEAEAFGHADGHFPQGCERK